MVAVNALPGCMRAKSLSLALIFLPKRGPKFLQHPTMLDLYRCLGCHTPSLDIAKFFYSHIPDDTIYLSIS